MASIWIVDDDPFFSTFLTDALRNKGHQIQRCGSGDEALRWIRDPRRGLPELILLDVSMPGLDGFTLHRLLQEQEETRKIPVIIMTGKEKLRTAFAGSSNVAAFIEKPFDLHTLYEAVEKALKGSRG